MRSASLFSGAHSDKVNYVAWNPTHPELFCSLSQKDRRIAFWDTRHISYVHASRSVPCVKHPLLFKQKPGMSSSSCSRSPQSRSTTCQMANCYLMCCLGTGSSSCLMGRTPMTPRLKHNDLPWIMPPSVLWLSLSPCVSHD